MQAIVIQQFWGTGKLGYSCKLQASSLKLQAEEMAALPTIGYGFEMVRVLGVGGRCPPYGDWGSHCREGLIWQPRAV